MPEDTPDVHTADDQPLAPPVAPRPDDLADKNVTDLQKLADERGLVVRGTGTDGRVLKADLINALAAQPALPPDPRQQEPKHPLAQAAEDAAASARRRDRSDMFPTPDGQE